MAQREAYERNAVATSHTTKNEEDEDLALLRKYMRPEEDLRRYRQRMPWAGE